MTSMDLEALPKEFYAIEQGPKESLERYRTRFDELMERFETIDPKEVPEEERKVIRFLDGMNNKYSGYRIYHRRRIDREEDVPTTTADLRQSDEACEARVTRTRQ